MNFHCSNKIAHLIGERLPLSFQMLNDVLDVVSALSLFPDVSGKMTAAVANVVIHEIAGRTFQNSGYR